MSENLADLLCFAGVLLFLLGLLTGFAIPALRSPRIGLSAHVASIQSGIALVAFGLVWPRLALSPGWAATIAHGCSPQPAERAARCRWRAGGCARGRGRRRPRSR